MNNQEALDFAKERLSRISYLLEKSDTPCKSFYEKQEEMLIQAVLAMEEQADREKGCDFCKVYGEFVKEIYVDTEMTAYSKNEIGCKCLCGPLKFCPMCGRDLRKPVSK